MSCGALVPRCDLEAIRAARRLLEPSLGIAATTGSQRIAAAYQQTAKFLVAQGRITSVPSAAQIAAHVDTTFIKKALAGGCPS